MRYVFFLALGLNVTALGKDPDLETGNAKEDQRVKYESFPSPELTPEEIVTKFGKHKLIEIGGDGDQSSESSPPMGAHNDLMLRDMYDPYHRMNDPNETPTTRCPSALCACGFFTVGGAIISAVLYYFFH